MADDGWPTEWLRGTLPLLVLATMTGGATYGYAIASALEERGVGKVKGGTLYPLLGRLENDGLITSRWEPGAGGPGRKFFELTAAGRDHLELSSERWREFTDLVHRVLQDAPDARDTTATTTRSSS